MPTADGPADGPAGDVVLDVDDLAKHFPVRGKRMPVRAVDGVTLRLRRGRCLGLVGESGCGKTTTGRLMVGLETATSGRVRLEGEEFVTGRGRVPRSLRRRVQMVFQDPQASLDPRMTAAQSVAEPLRLAGMPRAEIAARVSDLLHQVGLDDDAGSRRPASLSGGQRQRVGIARALALEPAVIVADEPTSALDVSVRAQVVNLLRDIQRRLDLSMVFISHDLSTVRYLCDDVAVMYLGRVVEQGGVDDVFERPSHPYTRALLDAVPVADPAIEAGRLVAVLPGDPPDPANPPSGCSFRTRCPRAEERCAQARPLLESLDGGSHIVACHVVRRAAPV